LDYDLVGVVYYSSVVPSYSFLVLSFPLLSWLFQHVELSDLVHDDLDPQLAIVSLVLFVARWSVLVELDSLHTVAEDPSFDPEDSLAWINWKGACHNANKVVDWVGRTYLEVRFGLRWSGKRGRKLLAPVLLMERDQLVVARSFVEDLLHLEELSKRVAFVRGVAVGGIAVPLVGDLEVVVEVELLEEGEELVAEVGIAFE
jgi:hypothetical protein